MVRVAAPEILTRLPPTHDELDERADLTERPGRGPVEAVEWVCTNTSAHRGEKLVTNMPTRNFLLDLPPLYCVQCRSVNPAGYRWALSMFTVRDVPMDCPIRDQGSFDTCIGHAFIAAMDFKRKIEAALAYGVWVGQPLSIVHLFTMFRKEWGVVFGSEDAFDLLEDWEEFVIYLAQRGIRYETPFIEGYPRPPTRHILQMGAAFHVSGLDVELIVRLLAAGFPLVSRANYGRAFTLVNGDEIYDSGDAAVHNDASHSVVLFGSGVLSYPGNPTVHSKFSMERWPLNPSTQTPGPRIHFMARNSWNYKTHHKKGSRDDLGGDFCFWADQIPKNYVVWGFEIPDP